MLYCDKNFDEVDCFFDFIVKCFVYVVFEVGLGDWNEGFVIVRGVGLERGVESIRRVNFEVLLDWNLYVYGVIVVFVNYDFDIMYCGVWGEWR